MRRIFTSTPGEHGHHPIGGVLCFVVALFLFACLDTVAKFLTRHYPVPLVAGARYLAQFALMTAILAPVFGRNLIRTRRTFLVIVRSFCLVLVTGLFLSAFSRMPLAEATSVLFVAPLLVVLLSKPMLNEHIGAPRWLAVAVGFVGVLLIVRPGGDLDAWGVAFALLAAVFNALYQLLSRMLGSGERAVALLYYSALAGTVAFGALAPWFWDGPRPNAWYYFLFVAMGVLGGLGHLLYTEAFRHAPASLLAPINYLQLVWAGVLGWIVFGQFPDGVSLIGMTIVAASGIAVALFGRRRAKLPPSPP